MTVTKTGITNVAFAGSGSTGPFAITTMDVRDLDQLVVVVLDDTTGAVLSTLVYVTGAPAAGQYTTVLNVSGGVDITTGTAVAAGETLLAMRNTPFLQETDFQYAGRFPSSSAERGYDYSRMLQQEHDQVAYEKMIFPNVDEAGTVSLTAGAAVGTVYDGWNGHDFPLDDGDTYYDLIFAVWARTFASGPYNWTLRVNVHLGTTGDHTDAATEFATFVGSISAGEAQPQFGAAGRLTVKPTAGQLLSVTCNAAGVDVTVAGADTALLLRRRVERWPHRRTYFI